MEFRSVASWGRGTGPLLALLLSVCLLFWLAPAPLGQPDVEYWGHYARVGPSLGFIVNHDSYGYLEVAQEPSRLLRPQEVRQSRPLYALLGAAAGYPLTAALALAGQLGLAPRWPPDDLRFYGFYSGYVVLNGLTLLASLLLFRSLVNQITAGQGRGWQFYALAWVLVANPITKAFFWTAHQQMLAFLVPLFCLWLALWVGRRARSWRQLASLALVLGLLPLVYGSFVLAWPALAYGLARQRPGWPGLGARLAGSALLFALPTLGWIVALRSLGTTYYNHEAVRYHQLVWLPEAWGQPGFGQVVLGKLSSYVGSMQVMSYWLLVGVGLLAATWWRRRRQGTLLPQATAPALAWVFGCFVSFFALLGYYPERLAYTLLPLVLCLVAGLLPHWPGRYARPTALLAAAGWQLYVLFSYGPFS